MLIIAPINSLSKRLSFLAIGVILLTGTGVVPPDDFSLAADDLVSIEVSGIGTLTNRVEQGT